MSRQAASPAAQLLRQSRLFALPQALPRPIVEQAAYGGVFRTSDSATTSYPLRQAIATPNSSLNRGDWGLKRPLPGRAAKASKPVHNVVAHDTYESITDYHSAGSHVHTLAKFQELNVGMIRKDISNAMHAYPLSANEPEHDYTDPATTPAKDTKAQSRRWKWGNAGVRDMTPGEFEDWLDSAVSVRKDEFMALLQARAHREALGDKRAKVAAAMAHDPNAHNGVSSKALLDEAELREDERAALTPQEGLMDKDVVDARDRYTTWVESLSIPQLTNYLSRSASKALHYRDLLLQAFVNQYAGQLTTDSSPHCQSLRGQLQSWSADTSGAITEVMLPKVSLPDQAWNPQSWLKFFSFSEKCESDFLEGFVKGSATEWDKSGTKFANYLRTKRFDTTINSSLSQYVREFLDLPDIPLAPRASQGNDRFNLSEEAFHLSTHPTVGLSYLRTSGILNNHPILGPQNTAPPVAARVIAGNSPRGGDEAIGVAGFVSVHKDGVTTKRFQEIEHTRMSRAVSKVFVNSGGNVIIETSKYHDNDALNVQKGRLTPETAAERLLVRGNIGNSIAEPLDNDSVDQLKEMLARRPVARKPNSAVASLNAVSAKIDAQKAEKPTK